MRDWRELEDLQPELRKIVRGDEDALQEANVRLIALSVKRRESIHKFAPYAKRVAQRCVVDNVRRESRLPKAIPLPEAVPSWAPTPLEAVCKAEERQRLDAEVARLTPRQREALEHPCRANHSNRYKALNNLRKHLGTAHSRDTIGIPGKLTPVKS
jgi:RNA polymerase sigma factor (sigma-70 family)